MEEWKEGHEGVRHLCILCKHEKSLAAASNPREL